MDIKCNKGDGEHSHATFDELVACIGGDRFDIRVTATPRVPRAARTDAIRPVSGAPTMRNPAGRPTGRQLGKIAVEEGSWRDAYEGTKAEASALIAALLAPETREMFQLPAMDVSLDDDAWEVFPRERAFRRGELHYSWRSFDRETGELNGTPPKGTPVSEEPEVVPTTDPAYYDEPVTAEPTSSDKLKMFSTMLARIPEGYYALDLGEGLRFIRVSRPTRGDYAGTMKVQTIHGQSLRLVWLLRRTGTMSVYDRSFDIEAHILTLIADHKKAAWEYAKKIGKCARCNTRLTDPRSRHYGIGPECEKHWPEYIDEIDLMDAEERERK